MSNLISLETARKIYSDKAAFNKASKGLQAMVLEILRVSNVKSREVDLGQIRPLPILSAEVRAKVTRKRTVTNFDNYCVLPQAIDINTGGYIPFNKVQAKTFKRVMNKTGDFNKALLAARSFN